MLQPAGEWFWFCENHRLMLSLKANLQFETAYPTNRLINAPRDKQFFSVTDSERYACLAEQLEQSALTMNAAHKTQLILNAVAALAFHKPVTLRSWYFAEQQDFGSIRQLASLENAQGKGHVLVLEQQANVSTCMVISKYLLLHATKKLHQFELIKVMKNRLIPFIDNSHSLSESA